MLDTGRMNQTAAGYPGVGDRNDGKQPKAFATMEESLMAEYKQFVSESFAGHFSVDMHDKIRDADDNALKDMARELAGPGGSSREAYEFQLLKHTRDELKRKDMWSASDDAHAAQRGDVGQMSDKALRAQGHRDDR